MTELIGLLKCFAGALAVVGLGLILAGCAQTARELRAEQAELSRQLCSDRKQAYGTEDDCENAESRDED